MTCRTNTEIRYNNISHLRPMLRQLGVRIPKGATRITRAEGGYWVIDWPEITPDELEYADQIGFYVTARDVEEIA